MLVSCCEKRVLDQWTSDSMGNHKLKDLKNFVSEQIPRFNLSHTKATSNNDELIPTYELKVNEDALDNLSIEGKNIFIG